MQKIIYNFHNHSGGTMHVHTTDRGLAISDIAGTIQDIILNVLAQASEEEPTPVPRLDVLKNTSPLTFSIDGNSPNVPAGQYVITSDYNEFLVNKKMNMVDCLEHPQVGGYTATVQKYEIQRTYESEFPRIVIVLLVNHGGLMQPDHIKGSLNIQLFDEPTELLLR